MNNPSVGSLLLATCFFSAGAFAGPFDGAESISCETKEVHDCTPGSTCNKQTPRDASIAQTLRIDMANKAVHSAYRKVPLPILASDITEERIALQGHERWIVWSAVLRQKDSSLTIAIADRKGSFVIFGTCEAEKSKVAAAEPAAADESAIEPEPAASAVPEEDPAD